MKILLIGSGGREHALAKHFMDNGHTVYCVPGNAGTQAIVEPLPMEWDDLTLQDVDGFAQLAESLEVDLTVVGPEQPLEEGIANHFRRLKLPIFAPTKEAAKLESSKAYAKDFMHKYGVPTARYKVCRDPESAYLAAEEFCRGDGAVVIKPSGLTAGKGVTVCHSLEAARTAIDLIMTQASYGNAGAELVVEECLEGQEVSILTFCDGIRMVPMPPAQDHKTLCDGDTGPNTGGMGAYAPTPCVNDRLLAEIQAHVIDRTQHGLRLEGISYTGVLYFGLMLTSKGPRVLEYNCRFGDPETQALLPLACSDLAETMQACVDGDVRQAMPRWSNQHCVCVVLCAKGYPGPYAKGAEITGIDEAEREDGVVVYQAGTEREIDGSVRACGGRVLGVSARAPSLDLAIDKAYAAVRKVQFEGGYYRTDIAAKAASLKSV